MKKVFISHSIKDKEIVDAFVDLILQGAMSIDLKEIFCVSTEGTKIKSGENWRDVIKDSLISSKVTFIIITPHYKESEVCQNEMGAAWVLSGLVLPTIVEPITFRTVGVIPEVNQVKKLLDDIHLDDLRDSVQVALSIPAGQIASGRWTQKKKEFINRVKKHLKDNPFPVAIDRTSYENLIRSNKDLNATIENLISDKQQLDQQVKELEKAKDAVEVKAIRKKLKPSRAVEEFDELCEEIQGSLQPLTAVIRGVIYRDYNNKPIKADWHRYEDELQDAAENNLIDIDEDTSAVSVDWNTTNEMKTLYKELTDLHEFMEGCSSEFQKEYKSDYNSPFRIDNKNFWEEIFGLPIN